MSRNGFWFATSAICTIAIVPGSALAQGSPQEQQASNQANGDAAGDIIVTARRREESSQSTPVAITAFSQKTLEQKSIYTPLELSKAVPGLQSVVTAGQSTQVSFAIRGRGNSYGAAAGSVETYFADVPLSPPFQRPTLPVQFFDLGSIQVLKGPQGTLFGRSTTGGAVLIVPAAPVLGKFEGYARLQGGNYDDVQGEAAINLPLGDMAALRVAGFAWHRKGYDKTIGGETDPFGNVLPVQYLNNQDVYEGRASLLLKPADNLTNTTIFTYHTDRNRGSMTTQLLRAGAFGLPGDPNAPVPTTALGLPAVHPHLLDVDTNLSRPWSHTFAVINTTTLDLTSQLKLKNIFGYIHAEDYTDGPFDSDGTRLAGIDLLTPPRPMKNKQITNELQLQGNFGKVDFIAGGLIDLTHNPSGRNDINIYVFEYNRPCTAPETGPCLDQQYLQSEYNAKSLFGSVTWHATNKLSFTAGGRYAHEKVAETRAETVAPPSSVVPDGVPFFTQKATYNGPSYNAGFEYKASTDGLVYGGYRHGWKRGGFNTTPPTAAEASFQPETDDDFYLGLKQDLAPLGLRGHFNIEGFYDFYHNAQNQYLSLNTTVGSLAVVIANTEKQTFRGFDMDFQVQATDWLDLLGNYTFVDAKNNKWTDKSLTDPVALATLADPSTDLSGNPVQGVSRHKFSLSTRFHQKLGDGSEIVLIPTVSYQTKFVDLPNESRITNSEAYFFLGGNQLNESKYGIGVVPGFSTTDVRIEWDHIRGSNFDLAFNGNNLFNKNYIVGGNGGVYLFGFEQRVYGVPRTVTVEAKVNF